MVVINLDLGSTRKGVHSGLLTMHTSYLPTLFRLWTRTILDMCS